MIMYTYALYTVFRACFPIQIYWHTCIYLISDLLSSPLCYLSFLLPACLDHITWSCTRVPVMRAIWLYHMYSLGLLTTLDSHVQILESGLALLYLIRVAQRERRLAVACPDPLSSRLLMIGSRDFHLAIREYFPVFHIIHPAFVLLSDHTFLRYYIMPCDNCVLVLLLLDYILPLCSRTLILTCTDA